MRGLNPTDHPTNQTEDEPENREPNHPWQGGVERAHSTREKSSSNRRSERGGSSNICVHESVVTNNRTFLFYTSPEKRKDPNNHCNPKTKHSTYNEVRKKYSHDYVDEFVHNRGVCNNLIISRGIPNRKKTPRERRMYGVSVSKYRLT